MSVVQPPWFAEHLVNNIPVDKCTEKAVVVFNTPGANANAVKELVLAGMLLASRNIFQSMKYVDSLTDDVNISEDVEKNKSKFKGFELKGKKLGIIGLGAIGVLLANDARNLGMEVHGYDPYISVDRAWDLSSSIKQAESLNKMLSEVDFLSLHMPLNDSTRNFLDESKLKHMKSSAILLNFARPEIIDNDALLNALKSNQIAKYVTDFPTNDLQALSNVVALPHLGASTIEAEKNCALMIGRQVKDFILNGNITNSVNFPQCSLARTEGHRITIINQNIPNMVGQITKLIADANLNILEMVNKSHKDMAYNILDLDNEPSEELINKIRSVDGILKIRCL